MYVRRPHALEDPSEVRRIIAENAWGLVVAQGEQGPIATHLPCLLDPLYDGERLDDLVLLAHVARADPIAAHLENPVSDVLLVFEGVSGYVSPSWYEERPHVGTWNFTAVHVSGLPELLVGDEAFHVLELTQQHFEEGFEQPFDLGSVMDYARKIAKGTVAFRLRATRVQAKAKLSQDKPQAVQERVVRALEGRGTESDLALAAEMRRARVARASNRSGGL